VDTLTFSNILLHKLRNRRIFVAIFWLFSAFFFFSKTQEKSIEIKANDRSSNKYVKTQEYYHNFLSILKKQVTSNFVAAKAPICDLIIRDYSEFSQTCSRYALLLKMILRIGSKIYFTKIWIKKSWINFLKRGSKNECGGAWETENQLFVALSASPTILRLYTSSKRQSTPAQALHDPYEPVNPC